MSDVVMPSAAVETGADMNALLDTLAADAASTVVVPDDAGGPPRDEKGRFVSPEAQAETPAPEDADPLAEDAPTEDAAEATEAAPEADAPTDPNLVPAPVVADRPLVTQFNVALPDGTAIEVPDLVITYTANGKERQDPIDKVVRLAQMGVHNAEREQRIVETQAEVSRWQQEAQQAREAVADLERHLERLLTDDVFREAAMVEYAQANTPEARLARLEAERQQEQERARLAAITAQGEQFYTGEIVPALQFLAEKFPTVTPDELEARVEAAIRPYATQGFVPPEAYDAVRQAIVRDVVPFVEALHVERETPVRQAKAEAAKAQQQAQVAAQKAKNTAARALKPVSRLASPTDPAAKPAAKPIRTIDDAIESSVADAVAGVLGS